MHLVGFLSGWIKVVECSSTAPLKYARSHYSTSSRCAWPSIPDLHNFCTELAGISTTSFFVNSSQFEDLNFPSIKQFWTIHNDQFQNTGFNYILNNIKISQQVSNITDTNETAAHMCIHRWKSSDSHRIHQHQLVFEAVKAVGWRVWK